MPDETPYFDLRPAGAGSFTLPARKWREIVFVRAMRQDEDGLWRRDPTRPMPPLREPDLFPEGRRFRAERLPDPRPQDPVHPRRRPRDRILLTPLAENPIC